MKNKKALLALLTVLFMWGFDFIALEFLTKYISPTLITLIRISICGIIMLIYIFAKEKGLHIKKEDWPRVFLCGSMGLSFYFTLETIGVEQTSASMASLIMATVPVFGALADKFIYGNKFTVIKVLGIAGSICGVALLVGGSGGIMGSSLSGILIMLLGAIAWTFFIVYTKPLYDKYSLPTLLTGFFISGAIVSVPLLFIVEHPIIFEPTPAALLVLIVTSIVCILIGEFLYVTAIGKLSVTLVSLSENVLPLVTVTFSWVIFGTILTPIQFLGGGIIIISVSVITIFDSSGSDNKEEEEDDLVIKDLAKRWAYDFKSLPNWDNKYNNPWVTEKIFEPDPADFLCMVYSIEEIRMGWYQGYLLLLYDTDQSTGYINSDRLWGQNITYLKKNGLLVLNANIHYNEDLSSPLVFIDVVNRKFAIFDISNGIHYKVVESESGIKLIENEKSNFKSRDNEYIQIDALKWYEISELSKVKDIYIENYLND